MAKYTTPLLLLLISFLLPLGAMASESEAEIQEVLSTTLNMTDVQLSVDGKNVHIKNAAGLKLEVFNVTGMLVSSTRIDSQDKTVALSLEKGIYILRVGNVTRKVKLA